MVARTFGLQQIRRIERSCAARDIAVEPSLMRLV
jgi:hypothetical protein